MENRLRILLYIILPFFLLSIYNNPLVAQQQGNFSISYSGPDTLYVDANCEVALNWGHPGTVNIVSSTVGTAIDTTYITSIIGANATNYAIGDLVPANQEILITYYAEDENGASAILTNTPIKVFIADTIASVFLISSLPNDTSYNYLSEILGPATSIQAMDNCGTVSPLQYDGESPRPPACTGGSFMRTWSVFDFAGNRTQFQQTITVNPDNTSPTWLTNPTDLTISCNTTTPLDTLINNWLLSAGGGLAVDSSGVSITNDFVGLTNGCGMTGMATVVFMAIDSCGNSRPRSADLTVTDDTPPTFTSLPRDTIVDCLSPTILLIDWLAIHGNGQASDVCDLIDNSNTSTNWSVARVDTTFSCGNEATYEAVFQVADACGNIDSARASYFVIDTLPPVIDGLIADTMLICGSTNKSGQLEQWMLSVSNQTFLDACGGVASFVEAAVSDTMGNTATWMGAGTPFMFPIPDFVCDAQVSVAFTFEDGCGNRSTDTAVFALLDTIAPIFSNIPLDTIVECDAIPDTAVNVIVMDNCDTSLMIVYTEVLDTNATGISLIRIWEAIDACNNIALDSQILLLIDTTPPTLMGIPMDTMVACSAIPDTPLVAMTGIFAIDNCRDSTSIIFKEISTKSASPDTCTAYNYTLTRTWIATDIGGNTDSVSQIITVLDTIAPTFILPADTTILCELSNSINLTGMPMNVMDDCDPNPNIRFVDSLQAGTCQNGVVDTLFRTWIANDVCGNTAMAMQQILLIDTIAPVFSILPRDTMLQCSGDTLAMPVIGVDIVAIDNCLDSAMITFVGDSTTQSIQTDTCTHYNYTLIQTWEATDACNNTRTFSQTIQVVDTIAPTFTLPMNAIVACEFRDSLNNTGEPTGVLDDCDNTPTITYTDTILSGNCQVGSIADTLLRTWRVSDACGNFSEAVQQLLLMDTLAPVFTIVPVDTIVQCAGDTLPLPSIGIDILAVDNCPTPPSIQFIRDSTTRSSVLDECTHYNYTVIRTWEAVDGCDNRTIYEQTIQVVDTIAPNFVLPKDTLIDCAFRDSLAITGEPTLVLDDCDATPAVSFTDLVVGGNCLQGEAVDTIIRTWQVVDACGNLREGIQRVILIDTLPPVIVGQLADITVQCTGDTIVMPVIGVDISALDNCLTTPILQLVGERTNQATNPDSCGFYNYTLTRTWRATDACNNQTEFVQRVHVVDTIAPTIICPTNVALFGDSINCSSNFTLPTPYYFDDCNGVSGHDSLTLMQSFTHDTSGDVNTTPVDTIVFSFNIGGAAPVKTITDNIVIQVELLSVDGEGVDEYFEIVGEDGTVLGETDSAPSQCGNSFTSLVVLDPSILNDYAADSIITFTLIPNGMGAAAINNVCSDGKVNMTLEYDFESPADNLILTYQVDNGPELLFPPVGDLTLGGGIHTISYYAEDCSGNRNSCQIEVAVDNAGAPSFTCPAPISFFLDTVNCNTALDLPFPEDFSDNCGFVNNIKVRNARFLEFTTNANAGLIPTQFTDTLSVGNINSIGDAVLTVTLQGDVSDPGEFFNIFGENGIPLGSTNLSDSLGACVRGVTTSFTIPIDTLLAWSADGQITISATPNQDVVNFSDFIGPCGTLDTNNIDRTSQITIELAYPSVIVDYTAISADSTVIGTGFLTSASTIATEIFPVGMNIVTYTIQDSISSTICSFAVSVIDSLAPLVQCNPTFSVATNPSGITLSEVATTTDSIFTQLSDNCGIADIAITPAQVSCDDVGLVAATIVVSDHSGNQTTCQSNIQVFTEILTPTFSLGACDNDTLYLFVDTTFLTPVNPNTVFSYNWEGPGNFTSNNANPFIPGVSALNTGSYSLTITGATGCEAMGSVFVDINELDIPSIQAEEAQICANELITLTTNNVNCANIEYRWFEIINRNNLPDSVAQIAITTVPTLTLSNTAIGQHLYYLLISCDDCISSPSATISVTTFEIPVAQTSAPIIEVCEGESIPLNAISVDPTADYSWVGPGYTADLPNPAPILNATQDNQGVYTLIVSKNGCTSESDFTVVNVRSRAKQPNIANQTGALVCEGEPFVLLSDVTSGSAFNWTNTTTFATFTTSSPTLQIDSISTALAGDWVLSITSFGCESETSIPVSVDVERLPAGVPFYTGGACEGGTIRLNVNPALAGATYQWEDSDGLISFGRSPEVEVRENYTVTITSVNGCRTTRQLSVEIDEPPVITSIFDSGDADPCIIPNETEVVLSADVFPSNDGTYSYFWSLPDGTTLTPNGDSILIIPNTTAADVNGTYSLMVQTQNGCESQIATEVVAVTNLPTPNPALTANNATLCEGERLELTATAYDDFVASYHWRLPSIDTITQSPILIIDPVSTALNGLATVQVNNGNCTSLSSGTVNIRVTNGLPRPIITTTDNSYCEGDVISLATDLVPGAVYFWEGPDFSATSSTPTLVVSGDAKVIDRGGYTVQIQSNGCESQRSIPVAVNISAIPQALEINNSGNICLATQSEVVLFVNQQTTVAGATYTWFDAATNQPIDNPTSSNTYRLDVSAFQAGTYSFYATQEIGTCTSDISNITEVILQTVPTNQAVVCEESIVICHPTDALLCAQTPTQGMGIWTVNNPQVEILQINEPQTSVQGIRPGETYIFTWTLSDPICGNYSFANFMMRVSDTGSLEQACEREIEVCDVNTLELCANALSNQYMGKWSQPSIQEDLGVVIADENNPNTTISSIEPGRPFNAYTFYWTISDAEGTCPVKDTVQVNVYDVPGSVATILDKDLLSCNGEVVISAEPPPMGVTGRWSSEDKDIDFGAFSNPSTLANDLKPGENTIIWNLNSGACGVFATDTLTVYNEQVPLAIADAYAIEFSGSSVLNVTENDQLFSEGFIVSILDIDLGEAVVNEDGTISYTAPTSFVGTDEFTYELCSGICPDLCTTTTVTLTIGDGAGCIVPTIITPNSDGINDRFVIPCLETGTYLQNEVSIFNQWGDELFRAAPYQNDWDGTYKGEEVPVGTYFYIVQFNRNEEPISGFLVLER